VSLEDIARQERQARLEAKKKKQQAAKSKSKPAAKSPAKTPAKSPAKPDKDAKANNNTPKKSNPSKAPVTPEKTAKDQAVRKVIDKANRSGRPVGGGVRRSLPRRVADPYENEEIQFYNQRGRSPSRARDEYKAVIPVPAAVPVAAAVPAAPAAPRTKPEPTIFISNLDPRITEADIREQIFAHQKITNLQMQFDANGHFTGSATVTFTSPEIAEAVVREFNGAQIDGRPMEAKLIMTVLPTPITVVKPVMPQVVYERPVYAAPRSPAAGKSPVKPKPKPMPKAAAPAASPAKPKAAAAASPAKPKAKASTKKDNKKKEGAAAAASPAKPKPSAKKNNKPSAKKDKKPEEPKKHKTKEELDAELAEYTAKRK